MKNVTFINIKIFCLLFNKAVFNVTFILFACRFIYSSFYIYIYVCKYVKK